MQIFYTSECPLECAKFLDDKRVIRMVTESAQILSTALHVHQSPFREWVPSDRGYTRPGKVSLDRGYTRPDKVYRATHRHHPCVRWASLNQGNYAWLLMHYRALALEYELRGGGGKTHAAWRLAPLLAMGRADLPRGDRTRHANMACRKSLGIDYTHLSPTDHAYRIYLSTRWEVDKREPVWTGAIRKGEHYERLLVKYGLDEGRIMIGNAWIGGI